MGPIVIRGETFKSARAAADALGVTPRTVQIAARRGRLHRVGLGRAGKERMAVRVRGVVYEDAHEAAAALGVTPGAIYQALMRGNLDSVGRRHERMPPNARSITVGPMTFPSMAALSRAIGRTSGYASNIMRKHPETAYQALLGAVMTLVEQKNGAGSRPTKSRGASNDRDQRARGGMPPRR